MGSTGSITTAQQPSKAVPVTVIEYIVIYGILAVAGGFAGFGISKFVEYLDARAAKAKGERSQNRS